MTPGKLVPSDGLCLFSQFVYMEKDPNMNKTEL